MDNKSADKFIDEVKKTFHDRQDVVDDILRLLDESRLVHYSSPDEVSLLSTSGRVLFSLLLDPTITQRALAIYLGISETMVEKTVKTLTDKGLITKTKVNRKNVYRFNKDSLIKNADIQRMPAIFKALLDLT